MPSPFPGMDPYLESPDLWPDVHHGFISEVQRSLNTQLRPIYVARVKVRVYAATDEPTGHQIEVEEAYLTIRHLESNSLVAVLEVMSPSNKTNGSAGRRSFMENRREVLASEVHWIEIDLLRAGTSSSPELAPASDYHVFVSRGDDRRRTRCWPISLPERLPVIGVPLKGKDPDIPLDLAAVLDGVYENGAYDLSVNYAGSADPPLPPDDAEWARKLLRAKGVK